MSDGTVPLPSEAGSGPRTFDLRPFRSAVRFTQMPGFRSFVLLSLGLAGLVLAVILGVNLAAPSPSEPFWAGTVPLAIALAAVAGGVPMLLAVASRPTRFLVSLRLDADGFTVERSSGAAQTFRWDDPELAVSIARAVTPPLLTEAGLDAERFTAMPGSLDGRIGSEARAALLTAARAQGLSITEEPVPTPAERRDSAPSEGILYGFARAPARPGPPTGPTAADLELPPSPNVALPATFDLRRLATYEFEAGPPQRVENALSEVTVTAEGIQFVDTKGRRGEVLWDAPDVQLDLFRRASSPAELVRRVDGVWALNGRAKGAESLPFSGPALRAARSGLVDGACYAAIEASARRAGLWVATVRFPLPARPSFWLVTTHVKSRGAVMNVV